MPVTAPCPVPSAFITQMSPLRVKAIFDPSGEYAGSVSATRFVVRRLGSLPSAFAL